LALDVASIELYENGTYGSHKSSGPTRSAADLVALYGQWAKQHPIASIEDGLADDDWDGWQLLTKETGERVRLVRDDLFVTTQPGSPVSSTNMSPTPFLSKSTKEDTTIADLAGVPDAGQIKTDSVCRGVRMVKYNQRLRIRKNSERASYPGMKAFATRR